MIYHHISLGEVHCVCAYRYSRKASCYTLADGIRYEINTDDLIDY